MVAAQCIQPHTSEDQYVHVPDVTESKALFNPVPAALLGAPPVVLEDTTVHWTHGGHSGLDRSSDHRSSGIPAPHHLLSNVTQVLIICYSGAPGTSSFANSALLAPRHLLILCPGRLMIC